LDLHVLGTPPAFNLSQDQTLHLKAVRPIKLNEEPTNKLYWLIGNSSSKLASPTNRRESPHKLPVRFLKSVTDALGCRCLPRCFRPGQKRNFKPIFSLRQSPQVSSRGDRAVRFRLFATGVSTGVRREGGASYCLVS